MVFTIENQMGGALVFFVVVVCVKSPHSKAYILKVLKNKAYINFYKHI